MKVRRALRIGIALATLVGSAMEARRGLPDWERTIFRRINDAPDGLAPLAWVPMQAGSLSAPFALAGWSYLRTRRPDPAVAYAAAGFTTWLVAKGVKKIVGRGRPYDHDRTTNLRLATQTDGSLGYVSGHAAVASTLATIIARDRSAAEGIALQGFALGVGVTRIYAGAHLPLDVVGGAALGVLVGEATNSVRTRCARRSPYSVTTPLLLKAHSP
ncbi:MAG: phosphatase PAP2 family protein [Actinomycetota bacterium]|nr:phosphatase PAP2 family protein [Actinomycetota bacterium]